MNSSQTEFVFLDNLRVPLPENLFFLDQYNVKVTVSNKLVEAVLGSELSFCKFVNEGCAS